MNKESCIPKDKYLFLLGKKNGLNNLKRKKRKLELDFKWGTRFQSKENGFFSEKKKLVDVINVVDFLQNLILEFLFC